MKKISITYKSILFGLVGILSITSCQKWLEVQPEDKFTKDQIYKTEAGVNEVVNGFYLKLGDNQLYGNKLTLTDLEIMAHRFRITRSDGYNYDLKEHKYDQAGVKATFSTIWTNMYAVIANINDFVAVLPTVNNGMSDEEKNLLIGQAIGLRAFIHFDLLRLFGPSYTETTKTLEAIPYVSKLSTEIPDILNSELVVVNILNDINKAKELLANSPVISQSGYNSSTSNSFNYFAALALEARVQLWAGNKDGALAAAKAVIQAQNKFPWITHQMITANGSNPDRKFYTEVIFGLFNHKMYDVQKEVFDATISDSDILATGPSNLVSNIYESNESDYRYNYSWPYASTGVGYRTFVKFQDIPNTNLSNRFMMPVIRMSEMYYIAAESASDPTEALSYLNTVRQHRNINNDITDYNNLENELTKEYMKEFYGEGQVWYFYKRKQKTNIFSVNTSDLKFAMKVSDYIIPLPLVETEGR